MIMIGDEAFFEVVRSMAALGQAPLGPVALAEWLLSYDLGAAGSILPGVAAAGGAAAAAAGSGPGGSGPGGSGPGDGGGGDDGDDSEEDDGCKE